MNELKNEELAAQTEKEKIGAYLDKKLIEQLVQEQTEHVQDLVGNAKRIEGLESWFQYICDVGKNYYDPDYFKKREEEEKIMANEEIDFNQVIELAQRINKEEFDNTGLAVGQGTIAAYAIMGKNDGSWLEIAFPLTAYRESEALNLESNKDIYVLDNHLAKEGMTSSREFLHEQFGDPSKTVNITIDGIDLNEEFGYAAGKKETGTLSLYIGEVENVTRTRMSNSEQLEQGLSFNGLVEDDTKWEINASLVNEEEMPVVHVALTAEKPGENPDYDFNYWWENNSEELERQIFAHPDVEQRLIEVGNIPSDMERLAQDIAALDNKYPKLSEMITRADLTIKQWQDMDAEERVIVSSPKNLDNDLNLNIADNQVFIFTQGSHDVYESLSFPLLQWYSDPDLDGGFPEELEEGQTVNDLTPEKWDIEGLKSVLKYAVDDELLDREKAEKIGAYLPEVRVYNLAIQVDRDPDSSFYNTLNIHDFSIKDLKNPLPDDFELDIADVRGVFYDNLDYSNEKLIKFYNQIISHMDYEYTATIESQFEFHGLNFKVKEPVKFSELWDKEIDSDLKTTADNRYSLSNAFKDWHERGFEFPQTFTDEEKFIEKVSKTLDNSEVNIFVDDIESFLETGERAIGGPELVVRFLHDFYGKKEKISFNQRTNQITGDIQGIDIGEDVEYYHDKWVKEFDLSILSDQELAALTYNQLNQLKSSAEEVKSYYSGRAEEESDYYTWKADFEAGSFSFSELAKELLKRNVLAPTIPFITGRDESEILELDKMLQSLQQECRNVIQENRAFQVPQSPEVKFEVAKAQVENTITQSQKDFKAEVLSQSAESIYEASDKINYVEGALGELEITFENFSYQEYKNPRHIQVKQFAAMIDLQEAEGIDSKLLQAASEHSYFKTDGPYVPCEDLDSFMDYYVADYLELEPYINRIEGKAELPELATIMHRTVETLPNEIKEKFVEMGKDERDYALKNFQLLQARASDLVFSDQELIELFTDPEELELMSENNVKEILKLKRSELVEAASKSVLQEGQSNERKHRSL